ncbi:hypothetical protein CathTA2_2077 [Caldalkalibacillus thermarum TA2.A1]|uniref:Uncharacterized protein n=1 Tax=Caldalkalibacillus thermarum (strain TA2.A1) TaxID=986075 RepID=F5L8C5_CALTT|nr:hypothetical protein [Caldalkalibacillus thermarum]EGL82445.1 hypothetical protein CathTA2_2077 [Caldalkalibacillus thermarum TA2.A1]QZT34987.1 hypothetical protein HUR95_07060 [Caldalkalibacillus thermarum TA2.A1]
MVMVQRILFLTPYITGARGNAITAQRIADGYRARGYEVRLLAYAEGMS